MLHSLGVNHFNKYTSLSIKSCECNIIFVSEPIPYNVVKSSLVLQAFIILSIVLYFVANILPTSFPIPLIHVAAIKVDKGISTDKTLFIS